MRKHLFAVALTTIASPIFAENCEILKPDGIAVLIGSNHINAQQDFDEFNPGIFVSWDCDMASTRLGVHKNSFSKVAASATFTSDFVSISAGGFYVHPFIGFAHYPNTGSDTPVSVGGSDIIAIGGIEFTHDKIPLFIQYLPGDEHLGDYEHLWTFGFKFSL
ncbi:hypothetical protein CLV80_1019 [Yoonia maritima]|uniref:Outer membrane protein with beta-barrel domain n=1 Tax=Yoonia maritima TaxID=1435347 RepID=A0A2T0W3V3_9RHOB|nr:hypothetical protein [Yoonia maritima]PRY80159.1 hypothetical protein CLV80_1019 [Yoonia maritima]